jgi:vacuolar-type H+-ATPase subunit B/Vma2
MTDFMSRKVHEEEILSKIKNLVSELKPKVMKEAITRTDTSFVSGSAVFNIFHADEKESYDIMDSRVRAEFEPNLSESDKYIERFSPKRGKGYGAREFKKYLHANDPGKCWGGLKKISLPSGHSVWLCGGCLQRIISNELDPGQDVI